MEKAKAALEPLESAAKQADAPVNHLMSQYQGLTVGVAPVRRGPGGAGKKRGPRRTEAIVMTSASRLSARDAFSDVVFVLAAPLSPESLFQMFRQRPEPLRLRRNPQPLPALGLADPDHSIGTRQLQPL